MKRYAMLLTVLVLTLSMFTGCGCTPGGNNGATMPPNVTTPMVPETNIPPTTMPTEAATLPTESQAATQGTENGTNGGNGANGATEPTGDHMPTTGTNMMPGESSRMR